MSHFRDSNKSSAVILTIILPFAGLVYCLSNWRKSWAKDVFWLACIYLGAVMIYWPEGTVLGTGGDGGRYVLDLMEMYKSNITIGEIFARLWEDEHTMDLYQVLVTFIVSRFTDNGHVLFAVYAFVFGYFYSRNMWYVLEKLPERRLSSQVLIVAILFLVNPITAISGARNGTAIHVFAYAMLPYLFDKDKSKLWLLIITPLIHFSYLYVALFAYAFVLLPINLKSKSGFFRFICFIIYISSLFVNSLNLTSVSDVLVEYSPDSYEDRIVGYVNQDVMDSRNEALSLTNWYVGASGIVKHWTLAVLLLLISPCLRRNFNGDQKLMNYYTFCLLFGSLANIMALIPSGGRFQKVEQMFFIPLLLYTAMSIPRSDKYERYVNVALLFLLLPLIMGIRMLFDYFSITVLIGNFVTTLFFEINIPIIDYIKNILS